MPPSAFDTLARLQVDYPMLFQLTTGDGRRTHSGVLEFTAEEGCCYIPFWMMQNLLVEEGSLLTVTNISLPKARFVKLQPQSTDFLEISNPRVVLEHALRNFSCVTLHDVIQIPYNGKNYHFELKDVQPSPAACIIETDCEVDFDAPVGYVEPERSTNGGDAQQQQQRSRSNSVAASLASTATGGFMDDASMLDSIATSADQDQSLLLPETTKPRGIRIVDGKIIRPDDDDAMEPPPPITTMLADQAGQTGVQPNAAIPIPAPQVDYWAVAAGDGARLDGKTPAVLKDAAGNLVDVRQLRAEAAARRAASAATASLPGTGQTVSGETVVETPSTTAPILQRKNKRVGGKYSRLKAAGTAFQGSANQFDSRK